VATFHKKPFAEFRPYSIVIMSQEQRTDSGAESPALSRSASPEPQLERSPSNEAAPRRRPYKRRGGRENRGLDLPIEDTSRSLTQTVGQVGQTANQVGQTAQQAASPAGGKDTLKLRLDLNLDVDIQIKARVHGDVTLSLQRVPF
jgi:hypothetical protein